MKIVIVGAGEVGSHLAKMLRNSSNDVTVIDNDGERLQRVTSIADVGAVNGSPTSIEVLRSADVASANLFIAVYPRAMQHINIVSALIAKKLGAEKVVARINVDKVMIFGGSVIAEMLARSLSRQISDIKILEIDKNRCFELAEKLGSSNVQIVNGDGRNSDFLLDEGIKNYDAFVALTDSDETNILSCVAARKFGVGRTIAEVENIEYIHLAEDMGVDTVINKKLITAGRIFKFTLSGKARLVKYISGTSAEILEYTVSASSKITKGALKDLDFPKEAIIGGVIRGNDSFIAVGDTVIEAYDRVVVFAKSDAVREVDTFFK